MYQIDVSEGLISQATEGIMGGSQGLAESSVGQHLSDHLLDCIVVKSREEARVANRSVYLALGVTMEGQKGALGIWIAQSEGAKFWLGVITELKNRGIKDIFIACDGLKGFPEAIESVFPDTQIQLCIVHLIRNSVSMSTGKTAN
jgi:transposase-like protein